MNQIIQDQEKNLKKVREDNNSLRNESLKYEVIITQLREEKEMIKKRADQNVDVNDLYNVEIESLRHQI